MHDQPVAEAERRAGTKLAFDFAIEVAEDFVRGEQHYDVRAAGGLGDWLDAEAGALGFGAAGRAFTQPDDDVDAAVLEVERLRSALVAEAEDGDPLALKRRGVDLGVTKDVHHPVRPELVEGLSCIVPVWRKDRPSTSSARTGKVLPVKRGQSAGGWLANQVYWRLA